MLSKNESLKKLRETCNYVENFGLSKHRAPVVENCDLSNLTNKDLSDLDLTMVKYRNCDFSNTDFSNLDLSDSRFGAKCIFNNTNFYKTDLHGANFSNVNLNNAKLYGAIVGKTYHGNITNFTNQGLKTIDDEDLYSDIKDALSTTRKTNKNIIISKNKANTPSNPKVPNIPAFVLIKKTNNSNKANSNVARNIEKLLSNNNSKTRKSSKSNNSSTKKKRTRCPKGSRKNPKTKRCNKKKNKI